jgi:hypothetical protein
MHRQWSIVAQQQHKTSNFPEREAKNRVENLANLEDKVLGVEDGGRERKLLTIGLLWSNKPATRTMLLRCRGDGRIGSFARSRIEIRNVIVLSFFFIMDFFGWMAGGGG